jgi:hypothetical protein
MNKRVVSHRLGGGPFVKIVTEYWQNTGNGWQFVPAAEGESWTVGECYFVEITQHAMTLPNDDGHYGPFFIQTETLAEKA